MGKSRKRAKIKKSKGKKDLLKRSLLLLLGVLIFVIFVIIFSLKDNEFKEPSADYKKLAMQKLPSDIKKDVLSLVVTSEFKIPFLLYHYVEYVADKNDTIRQSLNITPYTFESQVKTLSNAGYTFLTASDVGDIIDGKKEAPPNPVVLTFDDGYRDFYTDVFPVLKKYNAKATIYVVPYFIDKLNYMFSNQIKEVIDSGLVELGAHTMHHLYLKGMFKKQIWEEVSESRANLEKDYGIKVVSFAYPYGAFDREVIAQVKNAGFKTAVTTIPGISVNKENRLYIYRLRPGYRTGEDLLKYLTKTSFLLY